MSIYWNDLEPGVCYENEGEYLGKFIKINGDLLKIEKF